MGVCWSNCVPVKMTKTTHIKRASSFKSRTFDLCCLYKRDLVPQSSVVVVGQHSEEQHSQESNNTRGTVDVYKESFNTEILSIDNVDTTHHSYQGHLVILDMFQALPFISHILHEASLVHLKLGYQHTPDIVCLCFSKAVMVEVKHMPSGRQNKTKRKLKRKGLVDQVVKNYINGREFDHIGLECYDDGLIRIVHMFACDDTQKVFYSLYPTVDGTIKM